MANSGNRKPKKQKSAKPLVLLAVILVILIAGVFVFYKIKGPTHNMEDLNKYFFLSANSATGTSEAGENELAVVLEDTMLDQISYYGDTEETQVSYVSRAFRQDGTVYLGLDLVYYNIDPRFYWDDGEKLLIVTNATDMITAYLNDKQYFINGQAYPTDYPVAIEIGANVYIAADFVDQFSSAVCRVFEDPRRVYITCKTGPKNFCEVKSATPLRIRGGLRSNVVTDLEPGEKLQVISDEDDWLEVINEEGFLGYVMTNRVTNLHEENVESDYAEPEYTSLSLGEKVSMAWHGVYSTAANENLFADTEYAKGVNVISPTWYSITYSDGSVAVRSDADYVSAAHSKGYLVWGLLDIDSYEDGVSFYQLTAQVLSSTSLRQKVINTVMDDIISKGIDGINVDIETVNTAGNRDYIEFLRELSLRCRNAGKYLTVDNYTPYANNANIYHTAEQGEICDYVIIMGYDDYIGGEEPGPNASLPFLRESIAMAKDLVDSSKLIYGIPFYTRFWYRAGENGALTHEEYGINDAESMVYNHGTPTWDAELGYNSLVYQNYETNVFVWLEDEASLKAKCELFTQSGISGVAAWKLGMERPSMWDVIAEYY
ncbi:MAG: hypothetical protein IKF90_13880 [Parasporobacterium sp.]|nr:hypothetical protein [Parasporobacterium sp.]